MPANGRSSLRRYTQPIILGVDIDPVEVTRGLLIGAATLRHGYLDVLGKSVSSPVPTPAQRAMNSRFVATVYERVWRPLAFYAASGVTTTDELRRAHRDLKLIGAKKLLDVACGPGNFTRHLSQELSHGGIAVGLDISEAMLTRAVLDNSGAHTCYVRGDARNLPFDDGSFDAVCCFGALYLMPEPLRVAREMVRVLAPSGCIAILTSCSSSVAPIRYATAPAAAAIGLRMFDKNTFINLFRSAGLVDIRQETQRSLQYVTATKPGNTAR